MILEKQTDALVLQEGDVVEESIGMSLDMDSAQVLMQMLSKNLYSDAVGSTIRECASNALDSHRRAGKRDHPIIVSLNTTDSGGFEFSVEDFGIGLDADDVKNIISKYGKSTKRNSTTELGMMGLGFKAPLAYTSSFYFICRKDGMERKYMMYEGEDVNTIDLLHETPTTEGNGVKVIVPVKHGHKGEFVKKIKEQLAYFQNVYLNVEGVDNGFLIYRHEKFQWSSLCSDKYMHICLDDVYYPLDFTKLDIPTISVPIALRFSLTDGVFPTPNRESIRYTQEAKQLILNRIKEVTDILVTLYNSQMEETDDYAIVSNFYRGSTAFVKIGEKAESIVDIMPLFTYSSVVISSPKMKGINLLNLRLLFNRESHMFGEYIKAQIVNKNSFRQNKTYKDVSGSDVFLLSGNKKVFLYSGRISGVKKRYIRTIVPQDRWGSDCYVLRKVKNFTLFGTDDRDRYDNYYSLLGLSKYPKHQWRAVIQEFQQLMKAMFDKYVINIDEMVVPQEFIDKIEAEKTIIGGSSSVTKDKRKRMEGEVIFKVATSLERYVDGKNCKWVTDLYKLSEIHKNKGLIVYGEESEIMTMDKQFKYFRDVTFVTVSARELAKIKDLKIHNLMHISEFLKGENKPMKRMLSLILIKELYSTYPSALETNKREILESISTKLANAIDEVDSYFNMHKRTFRDTIPYKSDRVEMLKHCTTEHSFDPSIYSTYLYVKSIMEKYYFINYMLEHCPSYEPSSRETCKRILIDLFKRHKFRINTENYSQTIKN